MGCFLGAVVITALLIGYGRGCSLTSVQPPELWAVASRRYGLLFGFSFQKSDDSWGL
jgi:hypothetical protein